MDATHSDSSDRLHRAHITLWLLQVVVPSSLRVLRGYSEATVPEAVAAEYHHSTLNATPT